MSRRTTAGLMRRIGDRLPLRTRVMAAFGLVSLLVASMLAALTWNVSSSYMLDQREDSAVRQATVHARVVEAVLRRGSGSLSELLAFLGSDVESAVLLIDDGQWISSRDAVDPTHLPAPLLTMAEQRQAVDQRVMLDGIPVLTVGLPMPTVSATYVEVFPLRELDQNLRFLSWMLAAGTAASGVAAALLGRWAASRALRPLTKLTAAAATAAAGDLSVMTATPRSSPRMPLHESLPDPECRTPTGNASSNASPAVPPPPGTPPITVPASAWPWSPNTSAAITAEPGSSTAPAAAPDSSSNCPRSDHEPPTRPTPRHRDPVGHSGRRLRSLPPAGTSAHRTHPNVQARQVRSH